MSSAGLGGRNCVGNTEGVADPTEIWSRLHKKVMSAHLQNW